MSEIDRYLDALRQHLRTSEGMRDEIVQEVREHMLDAVRAGEAEHAVVSNFGDPAELAASFNRVEHRANERTSRKLYVAVSITGALAVFATVWAVAQSRGGSPSNATSVFSVFATGGDIGVPPDLTNSPTFNGQPDPPPTRDSLPAVAIPKPPKADFGRARELGRHLGRFDSRLLIFPLEGDRTVCYALVAARAGGPGMSYCYPANDPAWSRQHFNVATPQSVADGRVAVEVFGVAYDDVRRLRVQVSGEWRPVPLIGRNGFYLQLAGVTQDQLGRFEAKLADGTVQAHEIPDSPVRR